jgi:hypothetical protein
MTTGILRDKLRASFQVELRAMERNQAIAAVFAFFIGGVVGVFALMSSSLPIRGHVPAALTHTDWAEVRWPFPTDEWGEGKAFQCAADAFGTEIGVYIRAKIGFCNCTTGVSDDDELDRLSDFALMGSSPSVVDSGHPIQVGWMKGRSRAYVITRPLGPKQSALSIAFNEHCDAIVATVLIASDRPARMERKVIEFLNSQTIIHWTQMTLGL